MMNRIMFASEQLMAAKSAVSRVDEILQEKPLMEPEHPMIDVYKRQEQSYTALLKKMNCGRIAKFSDCRMKQGMDGSLSVSYTHLDVYKRQAGNFRKKHFPPM